MNCGDNLRERKDKRSQHFETLIYIVFIAGFAYICYMPNSWEVFRQVHLAGDLLLSTQPVAALECALCVSFVSSMGFLT